jgi:TolB-like protein/thioredoxin-like negative regulator of GroEL
MSDPAKAIFLSYASQDADAARRICDALRAAGLEVWFDKSELRGGDAWDASIRRRIKDSALFVPVISATTNARSEGYFRLEWKLAVERSHLMADDQPFILPVTIDDSAEQGARVPDAFRARQWTRLTGGETPPAFSEHVKHLLGETGSPAPAPAPAPRATAPAERAAPPAAPRKRWLVPALGAACVAVIAAGVTAWQPWKKAASDSPANSTAPAEASRTESAAVLPFKSLSVDKENEYFADGISEELLNVLSRVPGLRVSARTASFQFKGKDTPSQEIARQLGVAYLVEGSVRKSGNQVRITAQLVKGADGFQVWAETFDRDLKDIFAVQDEIAERVASALRLKLLTARTARLTAGATRNPAAYEAYLKAREAMNSTEKGSVREAVRLLQQAVGLDPQFALAHGSLAEAYIFLGLNRDEPRDKAFPLAKASAERALALDDRVVQAHNALGEHAFHYAWDWEESDRHMQRAIAVDPNYFEVLSHLASHERARNRLDAALAFGQRSKAANPFIRDRNVMMTLASMQRYDEAIAIARQDLAEHRDASAMARLGELLVRTGKQEEGLRLIEGAVAREPDSNSNLPTLTLAYLRAGQTAKAREILARLEALDRKKPIRLLTLAFLYANLGEFDKAFAFLDKAYGQRDPAMPFLGAVFDGEPLARDPRFRDLLKRMKLDVYFPAPPAR